MKSLLKRLLTERQRHQIVHLLGRLQERSAKYIVYFIKKLLPLPIAVQVKENLVLTTTLDYSDAQVLLDLSSTIEYNSRRQSCRKEPETIDWIRNMIQPGDVVYDIGANVGAYSLVIDKAAKGAALVYAFEPSFSTFAQLCRNVVLNRCERRVVPFYVALASRTGLSEFNYSSSASGEALHALGRLVDNKGRPFIPAFSQPVISFALDDFIRQFDLRMPNHIKLDVDGTELEILKGAKNTLTDRRLKSVLVEIEPSSESSTEVLEIIESSGFDLASRHRHGESELATTNCVFVRTQPK